MAAKKCKPSPAAVRAAKAMTAPSPEMVAMSAMVLRMSESIINLEKTVNLLVKTMCGEGRRNWALTRLSQAGGDGNG